MTTYSLEHLADSTLLSNLSKLVARDRTNTAAVLAHLAEVDARRLYAAAGYPTMHEYCIEEFGLSEAAAYKRTQAARAARRFPVLFAAVADGRLHLAAVCMLAAKLTPENVDELVAAAGHQRKSEIESMLARRYPRTELLAMMQPVAGARLAHHDPFAPGQILATTEKSDGSAPPVHRAGVALEQTETRHRSQPRWLAYRVQGWLRMHPGGSRFSSPSASARTTSCGTRMRCSVMPSPRAISPRWSRGRSMPWSRSSRSGSSEPWQSHGRPGRSRPAGSGAFR